MQYEEVIKRLEETLTPILEEKGVTLVDIVLHLVPGSSILKITLDKIGGITVGDLEELTQELSYHLDMEELIDGPYTLELSSPGVDRVLKKERELQWAKGKRVKVITKKGEYRGVFLNYSDNEVELEGYGDKNITINRAEILKLQLQEK